MLYFKHSELVATYHVSLKTVHNWIDAVRRGKLDLKLHEQKGRTHIANTSQNVVILERLANEGKKYRNTLHHKVVSPKPEFYKYYNSRQILDIISNLTIHGEVPRQYNYFNGGATNWEKYAQRLWVEESPNILKSTVELLQANGSALMSLLEGHKRVNVIDVGVGNALPVKELLGQLLHRKLLHRYIAVDISEDMLHIAKRNIKEWFDGKVQFEGCIRDIRYERFDEVLVKDMLGNDSKMTVNLVLLLGGTPANFRSPSDILKVIYSSMGAKDLLVYTQKPDTELARRYFDFNPQSGASTLSPNHGFILNLLNIDPSLYEPEMGFDEQKHMRYIRIRLKTSLTIKFTFETGEQDVTFEKGDTILLLRIWHQTALEIISDFEKVGFTLLQSSLTKDRQFMLSISGVDVKSNPHG